MIVIYMVMQRSNNSARTYCAIYIGQKCKQNTQKQSDMDEKLRLLISLRGASRNKIKR